MVSNAIRLWILLSSLAMSILGAGVATHLTYLARVVPKEFQVYHPWLKAGAFFPDSLYSCKPSKKLHDFAESTHWPEFLISALQLWQERYGSDSGKRYSQDSMKLQGFLIGVLSHQVVDSSWHSLVNGYTSHGLLRVLAETEFGGNLDEAHNYIDVMGEFLVLSDIFQDFKDPGWRYFIDSNWSLPREEDVMELLSRGGIGHDVITFEELKVCVMRGVSATLSEVYLTLNRRAEMLNMAYSISPAAREILQDCWLGGEFDLVAMLHACLPVYQGLFEPGTTIDQQINNLQICGNLPEVSQLKSNDNLNVEYDVNGAVIVTSKIPASNFGSSIAVGKFGDDDKLYTAVSAPIEGSKGAVYLIDLNDLSTLNTERMKPFTLMRGLVIHTYTFNGIDYLLVSEPGSNSIHFHRSGKRLLTICDLSTPNSLQLKVSCVADIDGDGVPDLILSGTFYGENETGNAILVPGSSFRDFLELGKPTKLEISTLDPVKLNGGPFNKPYQHFGAALAASQTESHDGFLYVTCQNLGVVFAYPSVNIHSSSLPKFVIMEKRVIPFEKYSLNDVSIVTSSTHGMFGRALLTWSQRSINYIAISQHLFNRVFIYHEDGGVLKYLLTVELQHDGSAPAATIGFGTSLQYENELERIYISSPGSFRGSGAIWTIKMQELIDASRLYKLDTFYVNPDSHLYSTNPQSSGNGVSNFGKTMCLTQDRRLVIGAPQLNYGNLQDDQLTGSIIIK